jgi:hypothetical protein
MVLFIHHDAHVGAEKHGRPAPDRVLRVQPRQFLANQVALVQQEPVGRGQLVHAEQHAV